MISKLLAAGAVLASAGMMAANAPGQPAGTSAAATTERVDVNAFMEKYRTASGQETARGCTIVEESPWGVCVFDCGGDWCIGDCDGPIDCP